MMKSYFLLAFLVVGAFGCKKVVITPINENPLGHPNPYYGTLTATCNGKPWTAKIYASPETSSPIEGRFGMAFEQIETVNEKAILRGALGFGNLKFGVGKADVEYMVRDSTYAYNAANVDEYAFYNHYFEDGDVAERRRSILQTEPHCISITEFNNKTKEFKGNFAISLVSWYKTDTLRFSGSFSSKVW